ncbi:MAG: flagellar basal body-associated FliL family protein [Syntrophales bacterium]|nr:flagellar basal body-associated FliL family protein [Syntrophales bacterium]
MSKAELDKMDLPPDGEEAPPPDAAEEAPVAGGGAGGTAPRAGRFKFALFALVGVLLLSGIGLGIWEVVGLYMGNKTAVREKAAPAQTLAASSPKLVFRDFLIPLPEGSGDRILMISFVAELNRNRKQADLNDNPGIRRQIIRAIQLRGDELLSSGAARELLKEDLAALMNQILGEGAVKNVYLADYAFI